MPSTYTNYGAVLEYHACRERVAIMDLSPLRKFEIARFAGRAIEIDDPHVMGRANGVSGLFRSWVAKRSVEEIACLARNCQEFALPRDLMVKTRRRHEMPRVVHLESETICEGLCIPITVADRHENRRMDVTVGSLRLADRCDDLVEAMIPVGNRLHRLNSTHGLHPFVEVAIVPLCAVVIALGQPGLIPARSPQGCI